MKRFIVGTAVAFATVTGASAQSINDAQVMARCSADFATAATIVGSQSPMFAQLITSSKQSLAISRGMYQKNGASTARAETEARAWINTLNRQHAQDPAYVRSYLVEQTQDCGRDNVKFQSLAR
jgi:hypothetical protein